MPSTPKIETTQIEAPAEIAPYNDGSEPFSAAVRMTFSQREVRMILERAGVGG